MGCDSHLPSQRDSSAYAYRCRDHCKWPWREEIFPSNPVTIAVGGGSLGSSSTIQPCCNTCPTGAASETHGLSDFESAPSAFIVVRFPCPSLDAYPRISPGGGRGRKGNNGTLGWRFLFFGRIRGRTGVNQAPVYSPPFTERDNQPDQHWLTGGRCRRRRPWPRPWIGP